MKVAFLGTGGAIPYINHGNVSILVDGPRKVLLDCCPAALDQLAKLRFNVVDVELVFISHLHGDHLLGLPLLANALKLLGKTSKTRVYGIAGVREAILTLVDLCYPEIMGYVQSNISIRELDPNLEGAVTPSDNMVIRTAPGIHSAPNIGCRLEFPKEGKVLAYSGDTAPSEKMLPLFTDADLLIHDATFSAGNAQTLDHSTAEQAGRIAEKANVKTLALIHFHHSYAGNERVLLEEAERVFKGRVLLPTDLQTIEV